MPPNISRQWARDVKAYVCKGESQHGLDARRQCRHDTPGPRRMGPDKNLVDPACGARVVMNIAAVHVPFFCGEKGKAYKNAYDLGKLKASRQGDPISAS